jgi:phage-related protein
MVEREKKITARSYATSSGRRPVREWILDLPDEDRRLVGRDVQKVEFGWPLGIPYCRPLGQGLWEVRSDLTRGRIGRVIFFIKEGEMVLLHAFEKKTQRTPRQEIDTALKRKHEVQ